MPHDLEHISQIVYYVGASLVVLGTGVRFLWNFIEGRINDARFSDEVRNQHLPVIYSTLTAICKKLEIDLPEKPLKRKDG